MRLSKKSLRKLDKYIDLLNDMNLYIAINLGNGIIHNFTRFTESVPFNTAASIQVRDCDLDYVYLQFFSLNSFLQFYAPIYKQRNHIIF